MEKIKKLQVSAVIKIPEGKLEEFKQRAADIMKLIRNKGTGAIKYDIFINDDQSEAEVREEYKNSEDVIEHMAKFREPLTKFFEDFPLDYVSVYGTPSPQLLELTKGAIFKFYSFFQGIEKISYQIH